MATQPQPDPYEQQLRAILEPEKVHISVKASAWDGFYGSNDPGTFQQRFAALPGLTREAKAKLWDLKFGTIPTEEGQPAPEEMSGDGQPPTGNTQGMVQPGNIKDLFNRPVLKNPDGSVSTTSSISIGVDGKEVLIPTVINGQRLSNEQAIVYYRKTGEHLGIFDSPASADAYATGLHNEQERRLGTPAPPLPGTEQTGLPGVPTFKPPVQEVPPLTHVLPRFLGDSKSTAGKVAAGVEEGALSSVEGMATPENAGIMGGLATASAIPVAGPVIAAGAGIYFSYEMLKAMAQQAPAAYQAYKRGDYKEAANLATQAGLSGLMAKGIVGHTAKSLGERVSRPVAEPARIQPEAPSEPAAPASEVLGPRAGEGAPVPPSAEPVRSAETTKVRIPGSDRAYDATYALRELDDVTPSHNPANFQPNPKYPYVNDRNYADPVNAARVVENSSPKRFDPAYLVNDNPDATNGPPVTDATGNVFGGNSRTMILNRVYENHPEQADAYKKYLAEHAEQFGLDPQAVASMKRPVLVREVPYVPDPQKAIRELNITPTAQLSQAERAISDARTLPQKSMDFLSGKLDEAGDNATLADVLEGKGGAEVVNRLIDDGVFTVQDRPALLNERGAPTKEAKDRIGRILLGRLFDSPEELEGAPPSLRNKLERIAAPMAKVEGQEGWGLHETVREAMRVLEDARSHGIKNLGDLTSQEQLFGASEYRPEAITMAERLQADGPRKLADSFNQYANEASLARPDQATMFEPPTQSDSFTAAFGEAPKQTEATPKPRSGVELARQILKEKGGQANIIKPSAQAQPPEAPKVEFKSPEVEKRFQEAAKEPERPNLWQRTKDVLKRQVELATRPYEHLPRGEKYGPLIFKLKQLEKAPGIASAEAAETLTKITKGMDANSYDLFRKKVVMDDLLETHDSAIKRGEQWDSLAFGLTPEQLRTEHGHITEASASNPAVTEALAKRAEAWGSLKSEYSGAMKSAGFDVADRLKREDYFRHRVLENLQGKIALGSASRLRTPSGRGYLKGRTANALDYSTDYLTSEYEVMAQMQADIATAKAISFVRTPANGYNLAAQLKWQAAEMNKQRAEGEPRVKWQDLMPDSHELWQPREGSHFYLANSIPEKLAQQIIEAGGEEIGVKADQLRKVLAKGGRFEELALPNEVVATLERLKPPPPTGFRRAVERVQHAWKGWQLTSPGRVVKYNIRNLSGDAEAVAVGNPSAFKRAGESIADLAAYYRTGEMSPSLRNWFDRGGFQSNLQVQEMGDLKKLDDFARILARTPSGQTLAAAKRIWQLPIAATNFRESILRYATFLDYADQVKAGEKPKNYGASIPEEVNALHNPLDKAYKLSNDLLGAYDEVSVTGQNLRKYLIPFWSYQELNFRRYAQMFKNAANDGKLAAAAGKKLLGTVASPYRAYQVGAFGLKALGFMAALESYNLLVHPKEERELPKDVQSRPHIVLGRDSKGKVLYFSRLGNMSDMLEWFGFDNSIPEVQQWLSGSGKTVNGVAKDVAKDTAAVPLAVANKVWQSLNPLEFKLMAELLTGRTTYPDIRKPRTIRDAAEYIAESVAAGEAYRYAAGKPIRSRNLGEVVTRGVAYDIDPNQSAYYETLDKKRDYLKAHGKPMDFGSAAPRAEAARNIKLALRYEDTKAFTKYLTEYIASGGNGQTLQKSFEAMAPLYGLKQNEKLDFIRSLDENEKQQLERAVKYYREVFAPSKVQAMVAASRKAVNH